MAGRLRRTAFGRAGAAIWSCFRPEVAVLAKRKSGLLPKERLLCAYRGSSNELADMRLSRARVLIGRCPCAVPCPPDSWSPRPHSTEHGQKLFGVALPNPCRNGIYPTQEPLVRPLVHASRSRPLGTQLPLEVSLLQAQSVVRSQHLAGMGELETDRRLCHEVGT